jgi:Uma2 family endonuclease
MAELAVKRMTLAEFLRWEDGTDTRWELIDGVPVAMAPPAVAHGMLAFRLGERIGEALRSQRPCYGQTEAGIARSDREDTYYIADLAISCTPAERGQQLMRDPVLIVEVLSPSTVVEDRQEKIPAYRLIPSVQEILALDSTRAVAEIVRREGERWITEIILGRNGALTLASIGLTVAMADLYDGIDLPEPPATSARRSPGNCWPRRTSSSFTICGGRRPRR